VEATTTQEAREARAALMLAEKDRSAETAQPRRIRLSTFINKYTEDYLELKAKKSLRQEEQRLKLIERKLGHLYVDAETQQDVERFLNGLLRQGRSGATFNWYRSRLLSLFNKAIEWEYREDNPVQRIGREKEHRKGDRYLTNDELTDLLDACDDQIRPYVHLAALTGIRQGALLQLDWSDVDRNLAFISLRGDTTMTGAASGGCPAGVAGDRPTAGRPSIPVAELPPQAVGGGN